MNYRIELLSKRTISFMLALVLVLGCFFQNAGSLSLAASNAYETDTVLSENDYSDAATGLTPWYFGNTSGDSYPAIDPLDSTNKVMQYKHDWYGTGAIFLGAKFESSDPGQISSLVKSQAVQVKENVAYEVEYDYYVAGTPDTTMEINLAVGDNKAVESWDAPNITISYSEKMKELAAGVDASTGDWIRDQKATITLPADADFSNGKYLMIYTTACKSATIYFDNIKVTALAGVDVEYNIGGDTETIYYADGVVKEYTKTNAGGKKAIWYTDSACMTPFSVDTYVRTGTYTTIKLYGAYPKISYSKDTVLTENDYNNAATGLTPWYFGNTSGDSYPAVDPLDSTNKVMQYKHDWYGTGAIFLGAKFESSDPGQISSSVKAQAIQVEENVAYEVEYDYYVTGTPDTAMEISLAVGDNKAVQSWDAPNIAISYSEKMKELAAGVDASTGDWIRDQKAIIEIPTDVDFSNGKYLMIYTTACKNATIYFDNIKVTALAGVDVKYVTDIETKTIYYSDGVIADYIVSNADGEEAKWYKDEEFTEAFDVDTWERPGVYQEITLYGKWMPFEYAEDTVLFDSGYESATTSNATDPRTEQFYLTSGDLSPVADPTGGEKGNVLWYRQNWYGVGQVVLGWEYDYPNAAQSITAHKGVTYEISFDYNVVGPTVHSAVEVGIALGNETMNWNNVNQGNYKNSVGKSITLLSYPKQSETNSGWKRHVAYFTVDSNEDLSENNKLVLYALGGNQEGTNGVYFDNVKVVGLKNRDYKVCFETNGGNPMATQTFDLAGLNSLPSPIKSNSEFLGWYSDAGLTVPFNVQDFLRTDSVITVYAKWRFYTTDDTVEEDTVLFESGYEDALPQTTNNPRTELFWNASGDISPVKDPTKSGMGNVLWYRQDWYGLGTVVLGWEYDNPDKVKSITVKQGMTYAISYDYNVVGKTGRSPMEIGIAIGSATTDYNKVTGSTFYENVSQYKVVEEYSANTSINSGWQRKTVYFTVNSDADLKQYNKLLLYVLNGNQEGKDGVYFDNVKVTALKDRIYTVKFVTNGGNEIGTQKFDLAGLNNLPKASRSNAAFMGWYLDSSLTKPFDIEQCVEATKPITLYAKWHVYTNGTEITFDDCSYWSDENGELIAGRLNFPFVPTVDNGNNVMKYSLAYAASKEEQIEQRGNVKIASDEYPQRITLYDPDLTVTGEYNYMDVTCRAKVGKTYKVSFQYKVTGLDTKHSDIGIGFSVLTGNIRNSHAEYVVQSNRFLVENTATEWKTATTYFTVNSLGKDITEQGVTYYSDALMLGIAGYGTVLIDNISVTDWDIELPTYIEFSTKGGEAISGREIVINADTVLPKAVRKGYTFEAWYLDVKCTKKFNPATYKRSTGILVLYAGYKGMAGVTEIDFEDYSYYLNDAGTLSAERISESMTPYEENGNTAVKYNLKYSTNKKEEFYNSQGDFGTYGATIGLHDPSVFVSKNAKYEDAALCVKEGDKYWISFDYKAISIDTESTYPSAITFAIGTTKENSVHSGRQYFKRDINPIDAPTEEWKKASTYVTVPKLSEGGNRLSIFVFGYGELLIDNIKIIQLTDAVIFDTDGGTVIEPFRGNVGQTITLPAEPTRADSKFMGWCTDENRTKDYTVGKMEKGVKVLYAKFLTYQTIQDFEHYSVGMSERFETDYFLNKLTQDTKETDYQKWLGSKFNEECVRNGKVSVLRKGDNQYSRLVGLFYMNNPLTVGETYEISVWVKLTDYFLAGDIQLVHSDSLTDVRNEEYWNESERGARYETIANTELMSEYMGEWLEIKYSFTAKSRYVGLATPGITALYIDDACITLESADDSYARSIDGDGIKFEDWYSESQKVSQDDEEEEFIQLDLDGNQNIMRIIIAIACSVALLAMGGVIVFMRVRNKKRGAKTE